MESKSGHYGRLALMAALSFASMYVLMYAMVDSIGNVYMSFNQAYMAALMTAPMVAIELALMGSVFPASATFAGASSRARKPRSAR